MGWTGNRRKRMHKSGCHWKSEPHEDCQLHGDSLLCGQRREGPICHPWDPPETGLWSTAALGGLSSKELFGLHCQMPVQLCNGVVGHLADLQEHKMRQPDDWGWGRVGGQTFPDCESSLGNSDGDRISYYLVPPRHCAKNFIYTLLLIASGSPMR